MNTFSKIKLCVIATLCLLIPYTASHGESAKEMLIRNLEAAALNKTNNYLDLVASDLAESLSAFDRVKYLDIKMEVQDNMKTSFSITNVNQIYEGANNAFFNQNTLTYYDDSATINFGLGYRELFYDDKILLGANVFVDYSFDEYHQRSGYGVEAISSVFDVRANYYNAHSGIRSNSKGSEEALDGWDARLDYHMPVGFDLRIFGSYYEWENDADTYKEYGGKYGLAGQYGHVKFEVGYEDNNKTDEDLFASVNMVVPLGEEQISANVSRGWMEYISVRDQLYEPVERENKNKVLKIKSGSVIVSGY